MGHGDREPYDEALGTHSGGSGGMKVSSASTAISHSEMSLRTLSGATRASFRRHTRAPRHECGAPQNGNATPDRQILACIFRIASFAASLSEHAA